MAARITILVRAKGEASAVSAAADRNRKFELNRPAADEYDGKDDVVNPRPAAHLVQRNTWRPAEVPADPVPPPRRGGGKRVDENVGRNLDTLAEPCVTRHASDPARILHQAQNRASA